MDLGSSRFTNTLALVSVVMLVVTFYAEPAKLNAVWPNVLTYETAGLKCSDTCELEVRIYNRGWATQRDLRFELPTYPKEHSRIFSTMGYKLVKNDNGSSLDLGLLHAGKSRYLVVYYPKGAELKNEYQTFRLAIYSADAYASYGGSDDPDAISLPWWWWALVYVFLGYLGLGLLVRLFESKKDRYVRLLRERAKELKAQEKSKAKLATIGNLIDEIPPDVVDRAEKEMDTWPRFIVPNPRRGSRPTA